MGCFAFVVMDGINSVSGTHKTGANHLLSIGYLSLMLIVVYYGYQALLKLFFNSGFRQSVATEENKRTLYGSPSEQEDASSERTAQRTKSNYKVFPNPRPVEWR